MKARMGELCGQPNYKEGLRATCRRNGVAVTVLNGLTLAKIASIHARTLRHYEASPQKAEQTWFENELRLFHWVLIIESFLLNLPLKQFTHGHWQSIQNYFPAKDPALFDFQARKLLAMDAKEGVRSWTPEECTLLCDLLENGQLMNRWNEVARRFYEQSGKRFFRSSKQCREQWFNHLDPAKKHGQWLPEQDQAILEFVLTHGRRWALMCREALPHRTEHMIKNRFKSLLSRPTPAHLPNDERKQVRRALNKIKKRRPTPSAPLFPNKQVTTYNSEREDPLPDLQDSFLDQPSSPKAHGNHPQNRMNQVIMAPSSEQKYGWGANRQPQLVAHVFPQWPTTSSLPAVVSEFVTFYGSFEQPATFFSTFAFQPIYPQTVGFLTTATTSYEQTSQAGSSE